MFILFRRSEDMEEEYEALLRSDCQSTQYLLRVPPSTRVIGRYSCLPFYKEVESELSLIGSQLINTYDQHRYIADIENWYGDLRPYTPETWFTWHNLPSGSFVVKGRTNSRKFQWNRQMFCESKADVSRVVSTLLDDSLVRDQGLCVRQYAPLKRFDTGINGLPITNEWRVFCYRSKVLIGDYYWSNYADTQPYTWDELPDAALKLLEAVVQIVSKRTEFYVVDIAETERGDWIVIELNDGQMSGLSMIDPDSFYKEISSI